MPVDVISQGREPERDVRSPRFPWPRSTRWRIVAGCAAVLILAAALTVTGLRLRDAGGQGDAAGAPAPVPAATGAGPVPAFVICGPSTGTCSVRITIVHGEAFRFTQVLKPRH